jgi:hypothetical protein
MLTFKSLYNDVSIKYCKWPSPYLDKHIRHSSYCVNFWTDGIILFLRNLFGIWYKGGLFSLILCK